MIRYLRPLIVAVASLVVGQTHAETVFTFSKLADKNTLAPGGTTNFYGFGVPSIDGANVAFIGAYLGSGRQGVYLSSNGVLTRIVDGNTPVPGGTGNFSTYGSEVSLSGANVAFWGQHQGPLGGSVQGVFAQIGGALQVVVDSHTSVQGGGPIVGFGTAVPAIDSSNVAFVAATDSQTDAVCLRAGNTVSVIADTYTLIPGSTHTFDRFLDNLVIDGANGAFRAGTFATATTPELNGIYLSKAGVLTKVVDTNTPYPNSLEMFAGFRATRLQGDVLGFVGYDGSHHGGIFTSTNGVIAMLAVLPDMTTAIPDGIGTFANTTGTISVDGDHFAFLASGSGGQQGIYTNLGGTFTKLIDLNDTLEGRPISGFNLSREGLSGNSIAFTARFDDDNTDGLFVATFVPEPSCVVLFGIGGLGVFGYFARRKRKAYHVADGVKVS